MLSLWGWRFDPWPCSVGWGSGIAASCSVVYQGSSDLVLLWLWHRLHLQLHFDPWPGNFHLLQGRLKKKKKRERDVSEECVKGWMTKGIKRVSVTILLSHWHTSLSLFHNPKQSRDYDNIENQMMMVGGLKPPSSTSERIWCRCLGLWMNLEVRKDWGLTLLHRLF